MPGEGAADYEQELNRNFQRLKNFASLITDSTPPRVGCTPRTEIYRKHKARLYCVVRILPRMALKVLEHSNARELSILGYCMGAPLSACFISTHPEADRQRSTPRQRKAGKR